MSKRLDKLWAVAKAVDYRTQFRVYYEDTDAGGVVYHANYLKYLERARSDWLRVLGFSQQALLQDGVQFVVHSLEVRYLRPARLDDCIEVWVKLSECSACAISICQSILRNQEPLLWASVKIVCIDCESHKVIRLPPAIAQLLR